MYTQYVTQIQINCYSYYMERNLIQFKSLKHNIIVCRGIYCGDVICYR